MNDELFQAEYRTRMTRSMSDEDLAREMYEAGFKTGREELATDQSHVCPKCKIEFVTRMPKCPICYHREKSADQSRLVEALEQEVYRLNNHDMHLDIGGMAEDVAVQCPVCEACDRIWAIIHPEDADINGDEK